MKDILIVEDEKHLAEGLQLNFTLEGFSTDIANSVRKAQQYIEEHNKVQQDHKNKRVA